MGAGSLSSLVIDLQVNSAAMRDGMAKAVDSLKQFEHASKEIGEGLKKLGELAVVEFGRRAVEGIAEFIAKGAEAADHMGKLAQAAGEPVEEFSRLTYAMGLSGLSSEEVSVAFSKLNKQIALAGSGVADSAALFQALGVKVKDSAGAVRAADQVLGDLADRFAGMKDGASKSTLAIELFGKSGAALVPFLNRGRDGIKELEAEADKLGITLSGEAVAAATEFNDNLLRLRASSNALASHVAAELSPALKSLTDELLKSGQSSAVFGDAASFIAKSIKVLTTVAIEAVAGFEGFALSIKGVGLALGSLAQGDLKGAGDRIKQMFTDMQTSSDQAAARVAAVWKEPTKALEEHAAVSKVSADKVQANFERMKKAAADYKEALKSLTKMADEMQAKNESIGQGPDAELINRITGGDLAKEFAKLGATVGDALRERMLKLIDDSRAKMDALAKSAADFALARANAGTDRSSDQRAAAFGDIGNGSAPDHAVYAAFTRLTEGFGSFRDALDIYTDAAKSQAGALEAAADAAKHGDITLQQANDSLADKFGVLATKSSQAATAFEDSAKRHAAAALESAQAMQAATVAYSAAVQALMDSAVSGLASKLGEAGNVINGAIQGFKSGGIIGAIIGVIVAIIDKFKGFAVIMDGINTFLDKFIKALDPGVSNVMKLVQGISDAANSISLLVPVLRMISNALTFAVLTMEGTVMGIESVWAWVQGFFDKKAQAATQANIDAMKKTMTEQWNSMQDPFDKTNNRTLGDVNGTNAPASENQPGVNVSDGLTSDFTKNVGDMSDATAKAADQLVKLNEQLTNVPQGFKTALRRFQAMADPKDTSKSGNEMSQSPGNNHLPPKVEVNVAGGVMVTVKSLADAISKATAQNQFQQRGTKFGR